MKKVKIGLTGFFHGNMRGDDKAAYNRAQEDMRALSTEQDFDLVILPDPIRSYEDSEKAVRELNAQAVDFTMVFFASFGSGRSALPLAKLESRLGIWSVPEPSSSGVLPLNSFCGTNMFSAILANYLKYDDIPFKWFYGFRGNPLFDERFSVTLHVMEALCELAQTRIGCIGYVADGFENMNFDEVQIQKMFGTYVGRRHTVEEIVARAEKYSGPDVKKELGAIESEGAITSRVPAGHAEKFARINLAFRDFAEENGYQSLAISCWSRLQEIYGIAPCAAMSRLNEEGILSPCEGDVAGAINMIITRAFCKSAPAIMDLVAFDTDAGSLNLWHCGPAPKSMADKNGVRWDEHFNIGTYDGCEWCGSGAVADLRFKPGKVTVSRLSSRFDQIFAFTGDVLDQAAYEGSSGWIGNLAIRGESLSIAELISTIINNRVDHHYTIGYGNIENEMIEFAHWLKMKAVTKSAYRPFMENAL